MEKISRKVKKYEKIILDALNTYKREEEDYYLIIDKENRHYQLLLAGWDKKRTYYCRILMHFHLLENGIICIFENHTEIELVDVLMEQGVPKSDILLNFLPQDVLQFAGYAVA